MYRALAYATIVVSLAGCGPTVPVESEAGSADTSSDASTGDSTGTPPGSTVTSSTSGSTTSTSEPPGPIDMGTPDLPSTDPSGTYLVAVYSTLEPTLPLQFRATLDLSSADRLTLVPLSLDVGSRTEPREEVGEPRSVFGDFENGDNVFRFDEMVIPGEANPITGGEVVGNFVVIPDYSFGFCGQIRGDLVVPLAYDLFGSTFGGALIDDGPLPTELPLACPNE